MKKVISFITAGSAFLPMLAMAQPQVQGTGQANFDQIQGIATSSGLLVSTIIPILIAAAVAYFFYGIIKYILAKGPDGKAEAQGVIVNGLIGIGVMVGIWGIIGFLSSLLGIGVGGDVPLPTVTL